MIQGMKLHPIGPKPEDFRDTLLFCVVKYLPLFAVIVKFEHCAQCGQSYLIITVYASVVVIKEKMETEKLGREYLTYTLSYGIEVKVP